MPRFPPISNNGDFRYQPPPSTSHLIPAQSPLYSTYSTRATSSSIAPDYSPRSTASAAKPTKTIRSRCWAHRSESSSRSVELCVLEPGTHPPGDSSRGMEPPAISVNSASSADQRLPERPLQQTGSPEGRYNSRRNHPRRSLLPTPLHRPPSHRQ